MPEEGIVFSPRTPFASTVRTLPYVRQACILGAISILSFVASALGLSEFMSSRFVTPGPGGPIRLYDELNLLGICLWLLAGPVAIWSGMKAILMVYKKPSSLRASRLLVALLLCTSGLALALIGAVWLKASDLLACGYVWCYNAKPTEVDPTGFKASTGSQVFFSGIVIAVASVVLLKRVLSTSDDNLESRSTKVMLNYIKQAERSYVLKKRSASLALICAIPIMLLLTGLLPNTWQSFTRSAHPGAPKHSLKYFAQSSMGIDGDSKSEKPSAWMVTQNWRWSDDLVVKLFPDTVLFYGFLEGIVIVLIIQSKSQLVKRMLAFKVGIFSIGRLLLQLWFSLFLVLFVWYWAHDHNFHGDGKYDGALEKAARIAGLIAIVALGLLLLPASKSSPILAAAEVSWESALWLHISLGLLFLVAAACHVLLYFVIFVRLGHGWDILPFNAKFWYPQNPYGGNHPSDNWTVPLMASAFWPATVIFGVFPWMRRHRYELFRYSHNYFMVLIAAALWHATHAWYFLLPGISLCVADRLLRFLSGTEHVAVVDFLPYSVDCWTDARPGRPSINMAEKITKVAFTWSGQTRVHSPGMYVLVNFPQVSVGEWHPFSLSSSPSDAVASLHIKHMGLGTFSGKLHEFVSQAPDQKDVLMNIQGPYGPRIDIHKVHRLLLVAGGIGVTPMVNTVRFAVDGAREGDVGALKRLHFIWSARSPDVFGVFLEEFRQIERFNGLPFELKISLYCSTIKEATPSAVGRVLPGMPNFHEILSSEAALGPCVARVCGPPPMVDACAEVAKTLSDSIDFEPWSFVL